MQVTTVYIPNSRLNEGQTYPFTILKSLTFSPDESYLVLRDPLGFKILMPEKYYSRYGFQTGQQILCRVDKVNCNGRIFLEPQHPHYKEGNIYDFEVVDAGYKMNNLQQDVYTILVKDLLGYEWKVFTNSDRTFKQKPAIVSCSLQRIKKGRLYLSLAGETPQRQILLPGNTYRFRIVREEAGAAPGKSCLILEDPFGGRHTLVKKYYSHYKPGLKDHINCKVMHLSIDGSLVLEPEHPCYKIGDTYDFVVDRMEELVFSDGFRQKVMVLKDCFDEDVKLQVDDQWANSLINRLCITARVVNIYKSRLELELIDAD